MSKILTSKKILLLIFLFCPLLPQAQNLDQKQIEISPESYINILGDAGIAEFTCEFDLDYLHLPDSIFYNFKNSTITFKNSVLVLKNRGFDCGNKSRNKDFRGMVRAEEYSEMRLTIKEVHIQGAGKVIANVDIRIAGKENNYDIEVDIPEKNPMRIKGQFKINVLDFGLKPITKMFGLIKVDEIIDINMDLILME